MKILAIESASLTASCAVSEDFSLLGEFTLNHKKTHSEKLMPLIEELLDELNIKITDIDVIAVSEGPGSYTGLRIGAAIAKSISFAANIPIAGVPTMMSLAGNVYDSERLVVPIMDAKAGRIYTGIYKWEGEILNCVKEQFPCNIEELMDILNEYDEPVVFNGDGSENYRKIIEDKLNRKAYFAPAKFNYLNAATLAFIGCMTSQKGETVDASKFKPQYLRLSQAERNKK